MAEAPTGDKPLTPDDAVNVLEEIIEAQNQSYVLGLKLKLPPDVVESICEKHSEPRDRLLQILTAFLQEVDPRPTWRAIVAALRSPAVNLPQLAMRVEAAHFPDPTASRDASTPRSLDSKPTLPELLNLKTSSGSTVKIVEQIGTCYSKLGPLLLNDDTGAVTSAIVSQYQRDADAINQEILKQWLRGQGKQPVTWSTLLGVLDDVGLSALTQMIRKNLNSSETSPAQPSESHLSAETHVHQPPSPQQGQMTVRYIQAKIKQFEKRFIALKNATRECLENCGIHVKKVAGALTSLPADDMEENKMFLESHLRAIHQATDHSELFGTMDFHWNYQNYPLLDHLIREFDLKGVKGEMKTYKEDLQQFRKKTPLKLFCQSQKKKRIKPPPGFSEMVAEFNWPDDWTLEVVEEFRQEYADHYSLQKCAMMLDKVLPGSFTITWFIPGSIVKKLKVKVPTSILEKYLVTKLEIAGECVYPEVVNEEKQKSSERQKQILRQQQLSQLVHT